MKLRRTGHQSATRYLRTPRTGIEKRRGFTLLELLLASIAAAMLLSALYLSLNMTLQQTQSARDAVNTEDLSRGVFNRISLDLAGTLGPLAPMSGQTPSGSGSSSTTTTTTATTTSGMGTASASSTQSTTSSSSSSSTSGTTSTVANVPFQAGVVGQQTQLVLFTSRVPDVLSTPGMLGQLTQNTNTGDQQQYPSDLRRVVYWLGNNGGLYRQETPWVTGDNVWNLTDLPLTDDAGSLIAEEVKDVTFEYLDPSSGSWGTSWDGSGVTSPPVSMTPGPPAAVRITLTFEFGNPRGGEPMQSQTVHTVTLLAAAGPITQQLVDPVVPTGESSSSGSSSSSSSSKSGSSTKTTGGGTKTTGGGTTKTKAGG